MLSQELSPIDSAGNLIYPHVGTYQDQTPIYGWYYNKEFTNPPIPDTYIQMDITISIVIPKTGGPVSVTGNKRDVMALIDLLDGTSSKGSSTQSQGKRKTQEEKAIIVAEALASGNTSQYARDKGLSYQSVINWIKEAKEGSSPTGNDTSSEGSVATGPGVSQGPTKRGRKKKS